MGGGTSPIDNGGIAPSSAAASESASGPSSESSSISNRPPDGDARPARQRRGERATRQDRGQPATTSRWIGLGRPASVRQLHSSCAQSRIRPGGLPFSSSTNVPSAGTLPRITLSSATPSEDESPADLATINNRSGRGTSSGITVANPRGVDPTRTESSRRGSSACTDQMMRSNCVRPKLGLAGSSAGSSSAVVVVVGSPGTDSTRTSMSVSRSVPMRTLLPAAQWPKTISRPAGADGPSHGYRARIIEGTSRCGNRHGDDAGESTEPCRSGSAHVRFRRAHREHPGSLRRRPARVGCENPTRIRPRTCGSADARNPEARPHPAP